MNSVSRDFGWLNCMDFGVQPRSTATATGPDSTAGFQRWVDAMADYANTNNCGAVGVIPPGSYLIEGSVTIPDIGDLGSNKNLVINAHGARILHKPAEPDVAMFQSRDLVDQADADGTNGSRDMWRWFGGWFDGDRIAGQKAFHWKACSRMVMRDVHIQSFDIGVQAEFALHFRIQDSRFNGNSSYSVYLRNGTWTGSTSANSAGNGCIVDNVRFYGRNGQLAQLRAENVATTCQNSTFEGEPPIRNIEYVNTNTSNLSSSFLNMWCENNPDDAHVYIDTVHGAEVDFQYVTNPMMINVDRASNVIVGRIPWPSADETSTPGTPLFRDGGGGNSTPRWLFQKTGRRLEFDPGNPALWDTITGRLPVCYLSNGSFVGANSRPNITWNLDGGFGASNGIVNGSRGGNVALEELLQTLSDIGIIEDMTTP